MSQAALSAGIKLLLLAPWAMLVGILAALIPAAGWLRDRAWYVRQREFWGGAQEEVFSHWVDMVLMSGSSVALACMVCLEALAWRRSAEPEEVAADVRPFAFAGCALIAVIAAVLDSAHGEGTVVFVYVMLFMPMLAASYYLLRRAAAAVAWRVKTVVALAGGYVLLQLGLQLYYEPSTTGAPNGTVFILWLAYLGSAGVLAMFRNVRAGEVQRFFRNAAATARRPAVFGTVLLMTLAIGIPVTVRAHRVRSAREQFAMKCLDEVEAQLTDGIIAQLKAHPSPQPASFEKLAIPTAAEPLLRDPRIAAGIAIRIYVPLDRSEYLFITANQHFRYCDVRPLGTPHFEEINMQFIERLLARGGTLKTGFYSVLWSPYMAGRLLTNASGSRKAICLVDTPDPASVSEREVPAIEANAAQPR